MRQLLRTPSAKVALAAVIIVAGAAGWWLGSPLFLDNAVDEAFPLSAAAEIPDDMTREEVEVEMETAAETPAVMEDEDMPEVSAGGDSPAETPAEPAGPMAVLSGSFVGADDSHQGSGTATIYTLEDGTNVLRLEDFEVTNGPDLHVLLVPNGTPIERDDLTGYVDLGELKGNIGNQNYEIPDDVDLSEFGSIVIYCDPFHVLFASAMLMP